LYCPRFVIDLVLIIYWSSLGLLNVECIIVSTLFLSYTWLFCVFVIVWDNLSCVCASNSKMYATFALTNFRVIIVQTWPVFMLFSIWDCGLNVFVAVRTSYLNKRVPVNKGSGWNCRSGQKKHVAGMDNAGVSRRDAISQGNHFTATLNHPDYLKAQDRRVVFVMPPDGRQPSPSS